MSYTTRCIHIDGYDDDSDTGKRRNREMENIRKRKTYNIRKRKTYNSSH